MSKATPWVKWFPADFLMGTVDLEPNEFSVYVRVLNMIYDKQEPLLLDRELLARRCRMRPSSLDKALEVLIRAGKLILDDGYLLNERALKSIETRREVVEKSTESAHARWKKEREKAKEMKAPSDAVAMPPQSTSDANQRPETRDQKVEKESSLRSVAPPQVDLIPHVDVVVEPRDVPPAPGTALAVVRTEVDQITAKGTRLSPDWRPSETDLAYALEHGFTARPAMAMAENFRDYWIAQAGAKGRKANWPATWRTWVRRQTERGGHNGSGHRPDRHQQNARDAFDAAQELFGSGRDDYDAQ